MVSSKCMITQENLACECFVRTFESVCTWLKSAPWRDERHLQTVAWMLVGRLLSSEIALTNWAPYIVRLQKQKGTTSKRGLIYYSVFLPGRPCFRCSTRRPTMACTSSMNRSEPVSWPRCRASRIKSHSPAGIAETTYSRYRSCRSSPVTPIAWKHGSESSHE
jgi:hypothetical protein